MSVESPCGCVCCLQSTTSPKHVSWVSLWLCLLSSVNNKPKTCQLGLLVVVFAVFSQQQAPNMSVGSPCGCVCCLQSTTSPKHVSWVSLWLCLLSSVNNKPQTCQLGLLVVVFAVFSQQQAPNMSVGSPCGCVCCLQSTTSPKHVSWVSLWLCLLSSVNNKPQTCQLGLLVVVFAVFSQQQAPNMSVGSPCGCFCCLQSTTSPKHVSWVSLWLCLLSSVNNKPQTCQLGLLVIVFAVFSQQQAPNMSVGSPCGCVCCLQSTTSPKHVSWVSLWLCLLSSVNNKPQTCQLGLLVVVFAVFSQQQAPNMSVGAPCGCVCCLQSTTSPKHVSWVSLWL